MSRAAQKTPAAVRGADARASAQDGVSSLHSAGGGEAAPGAFLREKAVYREILRAFVAGESYASTVRAIATACGTSLPKVVHVIADLLARGVIVGERCQVGGGKRLKVTAVRPWQDPPPPQEVVERAAAKALFAAIRFEDDPRAVRDMGSRGAIPRPAERHSWGGVAEYGI